MKAPLSSAPSPIPKPENPLDGHLPSEQQRYLMQGTKSSSSVHTHERIFKAISWHLLLSKSTISCQAPDSATRTQVQFCTQDSVCHIPWPGHMKNPAGDLNDLLWCISFTLNLQLLASSGSGRNSFSKPGIFLELIKLHLVIHIGKASHHTLLSSYVTMVIIMNLRRGWPVMHGAAPPPHGAAVQCGTVQMSSVDGRIFDR